MRARPDDSECLVGAPPKSRLIRAGKGPRRAAERPHDKPGYVGEAAMIQLIVPNAEYLQSYQEAYDEYADNGISTYSFTDASSCDIFAKFDRYRNERDLPPNRVGEDKYWLVDDEKTHFIGEIAIRHRLNEALAQRGGHIGYGVRYSEWNRGYGTQMLALALEKAKEMRISPVLITCNDDNLASARVMEKNGFILEDKIVVPEDGRDILTRRYWKTIL